MLTDFQKNFLELKSIIEQRQFDKLTSFSLKVPGAFNWVKDVFEPLIVEPNPERNMLEMVSADEPAPVVLTYKKGMADKIFAYCKQHLAPYKTPRLLEFVSELPKTISGKIRRVELRAAEEERKATNQKNLQEYTPGRQN